MAHAYIVETLRTAGGRRGGALRDWRPADMGAAVLDALVDALVAGTASGGWHDLRAQCPLPHCSPVAPMRRIGRTCS